MNAILLRFLRQYMNLSQSRLAARIGCLQNQVSDWERGIVQISDKRLKLFFDKCLGDAWFLNVRHSDKGYRINIETIQNEESHASAVR